MVFGKKEVKLFGFTHVLSNMNWAISKLDPHLVEGGKIAIEVIPTYLKLFERLYKEELTPGKEIEELRRGFKDQFTKAVGPKLKSSLIESGILTEERYNVGGMRFWFEVFKHAKSKGMKVISLESEAKYNRSMRMNMRQELLERGVEIESIGRNTQGIARDWDKELARDSPLRQKEREVTISSKESVMANIVDLEKPDLIAVGRQHTVGLQEVELKKTKLNLVFGEFRSLKAIAARERYRQRIKTTKQRLKSLPRAKRRKKKKSTRAINKLARMHRI